jgi:hypothetical protein
LSIELVSWYSCNPDLRYLSFRAERSGVEKSSRALT